MKLKTLKDLKYEIEVRGDIIQTEVVKQEAIKHIKSGKMVEGAKYWAIDFFNISEDDLE